MPHDDASPSTPLASLDTAPQPEPQAASPEDEGFLPLDPREITANRMLGYPFALTVWTIVVIFSSTLLLANGLGRFLPLLAVGWLILAACLFWLAHFWPPLAHRHIRWRNSDIGLEIRFGVWWKHRITVPIARVQHVDVSQGPLQRAFDLGKLTVHTAGTKNSSVELDGLQHDQALQLRDQLIAQKESLDVL